MNHVHAVSVQRAADVISAEGELTSTESTVVSSFRCLVEPLSPKQIQLLAGRVTNPRYRLTWTPPRTGEEPRDGDRVTFLTGPGVPVGMQCTLTEVLHDTMRPGTPGYKTGILEAVQGAS